MSSESVRLNETGESRDAVLVKIKLAEGQDILSFSPVASAAPAASFKSRYRKCLGTHIGARPITSRRALPMNASDKGGLIRRVQSA